MFLLEREPSLNRLLSRPVLAVGFAFDKYLITFHTTIPAEANGLGSLGLFETALVEFPVIRVIVVDGRDGGVLFFEFFLRVKDENGKVL